MSALVELALLTLSLATGAPAQATDVPRLDERAARIAAHPRDLRRPPLQPFAATPPRHFDLDRGARLLVIENRELPLVDGTLLFRGGSSSDPVDRAGLAELLADALRGGGSETTPGTQLDDQLDSYAATISISAEPDAMRIDFSCLSEDLDSVLEAIGELLVIPAYPAEEVEKSRKRLLTGLRGRDSDPRWQADAALLRAVYGADARAARQPTERSVSAITREELLTFHHEHLGVNRLVIGVTGDVQEATLGAQFETLLTRLPLARARLSRELSPFLQPARTRIYLVDRPQALQSEVRIAAPGTRRIDQDFSALSLWSYAMGFGSASNRMMVRLRAELGLVYSGALYYLPGWERAGHMHAYFATRNDGVGEAIVALQAVLRDGLAPLPRAEFETVRDRVRRAEVFQVDSPRKVLARALDLELHGYEPEFWTRHAERLGQLDASAVSQAVKRRLNPDRLVVVALGPAQVLAPQLEALGELVAWSTSELDAVASSEQLFRAAGGRAAWRETRFLEFELDIVRTGHPPASEHIWLDLDGPRMRVEQTLGDARVTRVINEQGAWLAAGESVVQLSGPEHASLLARAEREWSCVLRELATLQPEELGTTEGKRLEIRGGSLLGTWLEIDDSGHPSRLGYELGGRPIELEFSGWTDYDGVFAPTEILELQESRRRRVRRVSAHDELAAALFARP